MPKRAKKRNNNQGRGGSSSSSARAIDRLIGQSSNVVGRAEANVPSSDYERGSPSWQIVQHPPSLRNNITWVQGKVQITQAISNSTPTEANQDFRLSYVTDLAGLASYFDQYCIYAITVSVAPSWEGAGSTLYNFGTCITAIDYDNVNNLSSFTAVEAYQSAVVLEMSPGNAIQRFLKPCVAPALYTSAGSFSGYGVERLWVDSSVTTVPHYGLRVFFISNTVSGLSATIDVNYVIGFRNNM